MKHYKFLILSILLLSAGAAMASVSELFENSDVNTTRADISKYFLTRGGQISHGEAYNSTTMQAAERVMEGRNVVTRNFIFNFAPDDNGTRVNMAMFKTVAGGKTQNAPVVEEQKVIEDIKASSKAKYLYGLGFDFETYNTEKGRIKAPKGKESGIKLTVVKYDAQVKGLMAGDVIVEINGRALKDIPMEEYATILFAKSLSDSLTLTVKRGSTLKTVTLTPRASNRKIF